VLRELYFGAWKPVFALLFTAFAPLLGWAIAGFALISIPAAFPQYCVGLRWLLHLPISARKLLWIVWLPATAAILMGLVVYATTGNYFVPWHQLTIAPWKPEGSGIEHWPNVHLPDGYWRRARGGAAPVIEAPWGERYRPETSTHWLGLAFYNPYSVGFDNSHRFLEWQFMRATQAVYGKPIPVSQIADLPRMKTILQQPKGQIVIVAMVLLYYLVQICALHLMGWKRLRNIDAYLRILLAYAPMMVAVFAVALFAEFGGEALAVRLVSLLPGNLWMLVLMAVAPMAGLYWIAEKLLSENEFGQVEALARSYKQPS
jgi:hypothetical protein